MAILIKTTADGRRLTVDGTALYLDGVKEADTLQAVGDHPNRERILQVAPDTTHMAGRVPLTREQALAAHAALTEARAAVDTSAQGIAEHIGQPFLRRRHAHVAIGVSERDQWMGCMVRAMQDVGLAADLRTELQQALFKTADFMRNQPE